MVFKIVQDTTVGRLFFGAKELTVRDVVQYSEAKNWFGKTLVAIKLFFSGKGIISRKNITQLLKEHPIQDEVFKKNPGLRTMLRVYGVALESITVDMVKMFDTGKTCLESFPCQHPFCKIELNDGREKVTYLKGNDIWAIIKFLPAEKVNKYVNESFEGNEHTIDKDAETILTKIFAD